MHASLRADVLFAMVLLAAFGVEGSSSKYAEPEAEGVRPVLRTGFDAIVS